MIWVTVLNASLTRRFRLSVTVVCELLWTVLFLALTHSFTRLSYLGIIIHILLFYIFTFILFRDSPGRKAFTVSAVFVCIILNELIFLQFLMPEDFQLWKDRSLTAKQVILVLLPYVSGEVFIFSLLTVLLNKLRLSLNVKDYMLFSLFPISQFMLLFGWLDTLSVIMDDTRIVYFAVITVICFVSDIGLYFAIKKVSLESRLKAENEILTNQILIQEKHYAELTDQYENIRLMRHDISNHILAMRSLLENGQLVQASSYLSELEAKTFGINLGLCKNPVIDAYLHSRLCSAREKGIKIDAAVNLPDGISVSNLDLIRCLGNMLDNAEEACIGIDDASIELSCTLSRGFIILKTENPYSEQQPAKARRIANLDRGIGTRVLRSVAGKYDGSFTLSKTGGVCTAELLLNTGAFKNDKDCNM